MFILLILLPFSQPLSVCNITVPIDKWLKTLSGNLTFKCEIVKGHFILNHNANEFGPLMFYFFNDLVRIEGCLQINQFTSLNNLFFLSKLKEIDCDAEKARQAGLTNVIEIKNTFLRWLGLNSLKSVKGPGRIIVQYGKEGRSNYGGEKDAECFTTKEVHFFATHPQFNDKFEKFCDQDDHCLQNEHNSWNLDIPLYSYYANCTVIFGDLHFDGPLTADSPFLDKINTIKVIIGKLFIISTLFVNFNFLPNLQVIYDAYDGQTITIGGNQYLKKIELPALIPGRHLSFIDTAQAAFNPVKFIWDPCSQLHQFEKHPDNCENRQTTEEILPYITADSIKNISYFISYLSFGIGILFSFRAVALLLFGSCHSILLFSRFSLALLMMLIVIIACESVIVYQEFRSANGYFGGYSTYPTPIVTASYFLNPLVFLFSRFCTAVKHGSHFLIPCLFLEKTILKVSSIIQISSIVSLLFAFVNILLFITLISILFPSLMVLVRAVVINKGIDSSAIFFPFVMHIDGLASLSDTDYEPDEHALFSLVYAGYFYQVFDIYPDILGMVFHGLNWWSDVFLAATAIAYLLLSLRTGKVEIEGVVLVLMYSFLSVNRIRWYLGGDLLLNDYCMNNDRKTLDYSRMFTCEMVFEGYNFNVVGMLVGKLPYILFALLSVFCWILASECHIKGYAHFLHEKRHQHENPKKEQFEFTLSSLKSQSSYGTAASSLVSSDVDKKAK